MERTEVNKGINVPAGTVWKTISQFSGIEKFLPAIASSVSVGEGEGMERTCTMGNGASFDETLLKVDNENMALQYNVLDPSPLPFSKYTANMKVKSIDNNKSEILWDCAYEVDSGTAAEADGMLSELFLSGIDGLEKLHS
jgi:hypothetical protein